MGLFILALGIVLAVTLALYVYFLRLEQQGRLGGESSSQDSESQKPTPQKELDVACYGFPPTSRVASASAPRHSAPIPLANTVAEPIRQPHSTLPQPSPRSSSPRAPAVSASLPGSSHSGIRELLWLGTRSLRFGGLTIPAPITYIIDSRITSNCAEPSAIDIALLLGPDTLHSDTQELGYWPRYDRITAVQRRIYLEWMATGRVRLPFRLVHCHTMILG